MHMTWSVWKALISKRYSLSFAKNLKFAYKQTLNIKTRTLILFFVVVTRNGSFLIKIVCRYLCSNFFDSTIIFDLRIDCRSLTYKLFCFWKSFNISKESFCQTKRLQLSTKYHLKRLQNWNWKENRERRTLKLLWNRNWFFQKSPNFQYSQQCFPPNI